MCFVARVQVSVLKSDDEAADKPSAVLDDVPVEVTTFFATPEDGIIVQVCACAWRLSAADSIAVAVVVVL